MINAARDTILVEIEYQDEVGGIVIPETAKFYREYKGWFIGKVISIGPEYPYKDELKEGDLVAFQRHEGIKVVDGNTEYMSLKERWVAGKYEEE